MLRRIVMLLLTLLLMLPCAFAEDAPAEAPEAVPAENPFVGAWEVLYYIRDGELLTGEAAAENPVMFVFTEDTLAYHFDDGLITESFYSADGNTCYINSEIYTLEHEDLIIGYAANSNMSLSFILTRIDPLVLNNPFIGTWEVLYLQIQGSSNAFSFSEYLSAITYEKNSMVLTIDGDQIQFPCTYQNGMCTSVFTEGDLVFTFISSIQEDGLVHIAASIEDEDVTCEILLAPENEVVPEDITQFFGAWREVAVLSNDLLITDQMPQSQRPFENNWLFQYDFSRAAVLRSCPEHADNPSSWILCTYADGACTILYDDGPAVCTIDANGLMCIRAEDGSWSSWLVRVEEEAPAAAE